MLVIMKLRHNLLFVAVAFYVLGVPFTWFFLQDWPWVALVIGLGGILGGIAVLLTPDRIDLD
jgi:hypothetical protein